METKDKELGKVPGTASPSPIGEGWGEASGETSSSFIFETADDFSYGLLKQYAKENRLSMTEAEGILWRMIRGKSLGFKFRRQHIIDNYIADFVDLHHKLIIELDGKYHFIGHQPISDAVRTTALNKMGYVVLRFKNEEVIGAPLKVLDNIKQAMKEIDNAQSTTSGIASPSPIGEGRGEAFDICSIGHITRDKIVTPDKTVYMAGGTSFYMTYGISHLPRKVSYQLVTKVGEESKEDIEKIKALGFDTICYPSHHTVFFENIYGKDQNGRTQKVRAKADPFTIEDVKPLQAKVFHLGSLLADDFAPEVVEYLATKGIVSIDVQGYLREVVGEDVRAVAWKDKERVLRCTGMLKLNESEMVSIAGSSDTHEVGKRLADMGVREVVMTLGSYGAVIYDGSKFYDIPPYQPKAVVDATGCGDTFSTGYLWCRVQGMDIEESGKFAAAMCSLKLEHSGPFDGTIEDIEARLQ